MRFIAHRANLYGPNPDTENTIEAIEECIDKGFDIEIDLHYDNSSRTFWLGHDEPKTKIDLRMLSIWKYHVTVYAHCKTITTLQKFVEGGMAQGVIPFFHDVDDCILLISNQVWIHPRAVPDMENYTNSILVLPSLRHFVVERAKNILKAKGICTDYPVDLKDSYKLWKSDK